MSLTEQLGARIGWRSSYESVANRSIYEDAHIFAHAQHHLGNLSERVYQCYRRMFDLDFAHNPQHLDIVIGRIHDKPAEKEDVVGDQVVVD